MFTSKVIEYYYQLKRTHKIWWISVIGSKQKARHKVTLYTIPFIWYSGKGKIIGVENKTGCQRLGIGWLQRDIGEFVKSNLAAATELKVVI